MANLDRGARLLACVLMVLRVSRACVVERSKFGFKLNATILTSFLSPSHENCSDACAKNQSCASYNFHLVTSACQLLNVSSQSPHQGQLVQAQDWIHMKNPEYGCYGDPCQGRGRCTVVNGTYYCNCALNYKGKRCESKSKNFRCGQWCHVTLIPFDSNLVLSL